MRIERIAQSLSSSIASLDEPPLLNDSSIYSDVLRMIAALAVIVGLIVLSVRFVSKRGKWFQTQRAVNRLAGLQVGQHKSVQLIEIGDVLYVIGVGDDVHLIDKIDQPERVAEIKRLLDDEPASAGRSFQELFYEKMSRSKDSKSRHMKDWLNENGAEDQTDNR